MPAATGNPATVTFPSAGYYSARSTSGPGRQRGDRASAVHRRRGRPGAQPHAGVPQVGKTMTASVSGATITFGLPKACVKPGKTFKVTLTWKRKKRKGNLFVKVIRADFYIGTKRVKIDKKSRRSRRR